jgi:hypothetical protein
MSIHFNNEIRYSGIATLSAGGSTPTAAKQRKFLKRSHLFFDKSLVRSFSSFDKHIIGPVVSQIAGRFSTKAWYAAFLFRNPRHRSGCLSRRPA